jgi:hypothetical protein
MSTQVNRHSSHTLPGVRLTNIPVRFFSSSYIGLLIR